MFWTEDIDIESRRQWLSKAETEWLNTSIISQYCANTLKRITINSGMPCCEILMPLKPCWKSYDPWRDLEQNYLNYFPNVRRLELLSVVFMGPIIKPHTFSHLKHLGITIRLNGRHASSTSEFFVMAILRDNLQLDSFILKAHFHYAPYWVKIRLFRN